MKYRKESNGFSLIILLISLAIVVLIFFAKGGVLDKYIGGDVQQRKNKKEVIENQFKDINNNLNDYNKEIQKELD